MISFIIIYSDSNQQIKKTAENMKELSTHFPMRYQIINIVNCGLSFEEINETLKNETADYVHFMVAGQIISQSFMEKITQGIKKYPNKNIICFKENLCHPIGFEEIDLKKDANVIPLNMFGGFYRTNQVVNYKFEDSLAYDAPDTFMYDVLMNDLQFVRLNCQRDDWVNSSTPLLDENTENNIEWYEKRLTKSCEYIYRRWSADAENRDMLEYMILTQVCKRFIANKNTADKHVFKSNQILKNYYSICRELLQYVDDEKIIATKEILGEKMSEGLRLKLLEIKRDSKVELKFENAENKKECYVKCSDITFTLISQQQVQIDCMNFANNNLQIDASYVLPIDGIKVKIIPVLNGNDIEIKENERFATTSFFGEDVYREYTFSISIPEERLEDRNNNLQFYFEYQNVRIPIAIKSGRFPSRINTELEGSYWIESHKNISVSKDNQKIYIRRNNAWLHISKELGYLPSLFRRSKRMFLLRIAYWLTRPYFVGKNIWITYDKMYKGGDNGEYFYKYAMSVEDDVIPKYIINGKYPDAKRLVKEGYNPLIFGTCKQKLYFLNSSIVATTHANIPVFSGILPSGFDLMRDLFQAEVVCIQHGLAVQKLDHNLNAQYDNLRRFYCASKREIENLQQKEYGYADTKNMLRLTGVPRYDGLINNDKKQILITPTWRAYISMPASVGNTRPYSDAFKSTNYFKIYNSLISNEKLIHAAKEYGYKIIYLLHPTINSQKKDYAESEDVQVLLPVNVSYEKLLTESSMMITDYSGVQFDFAYMRKPIIYYHPKKLPPHYEEGGFVYDTMGFGEIVSEEDVLVDEIIAHMKRECQMTEKYKQRADEFFAYDDRDSCKRIYEDLYQYQKEVVSQN